MRRGSIPLTTVVALVLALAPAGAQSTVQAPSGFDLSVPSIMRGPELVGAPPGQVRWTDDGAWIYFRWKPGSRRWHEPLRLYRVRAAGGLPEELPEATADSLSVLIAPGDRSPDGRTRAVAHAGDLFLIDGRTLAVRRLTHTVAQESAPVFSADGRTLFHVRNDNLFALNLADASVRQLTNIHATPEPPAPRDPAAQRRYLEEQQQELFEAVRLRAERREEAEHRRLQAAARQPVAVHLEQGERVLGLQVSPAGGFAVLEVGRQARERRQTLVPDWVTITGYTEPLDVREKVADFQAEGRLGRVDLATGTVAWLELAPPPRGEGARRQGDGVLAYARFLGWNRPGTHGLVVAMSYDYRDRRLFTLDAHTGALALVAHDHDPAWLGGPCSDWVRDGGCAGWLPDGRTVYLVSERDGWSHLYTVELDGSNLRQLTSGEWEVHDVSVPPAGDRFHLTTSEGSRFERHFFHMPLRGGGRTRITAARGAHAVTPSPDGRRLAVVHSTADRPPELYVMDNRAGAAMRQVTTSPTAEWLSHPWIRPEIVHFTAGDGARVPARIYRPGDVGAHANGAAVIFVHGAGYLQNVHAWWSTYYREYMFHHLLAARGYTVLDIDFRASAGHGRDWRAAIHRRMGGLDLSDQLDGARYLIRNEGVDSARIGIYGGSYGGFITLMALFRHPGRFAAGAALRSVTDWAHYNHWYTSRILTLPHEDDEAYRFSSPIYHAEGLQDALLIAHGMVDVNVHFQDVVRLAQRLIELGKTDWELAVYPVEDHAFVAPSSWTDEYRRILELFERHLAPQH
jgi:dipeptidyl aminopeptidase/acylaminoacyl peptidase